MGSLVWILDSTAEASQLKDDMFSKMLLCDLLLQWLNVNPNVGQGSFSLRSLIWISISLHGNVESSAEAIRPYHANMFVSGWKILQRYVVC